MTKQEIYDALKKDGAKLTKGAQFYKKETLEEEYAMRFGFPPEEEPNTHILREEEDVSEKDVENIRVLKFVDSGWCNELNRSYFAGLYMPKSYAEFEILKRYASEVL